MTRATEPTPAPEPTSAREPTSVPESTFTMGPTVIPQPASTAAESTSAATEPASGVAAVGREAEKAAGTALGLRPMRELSEADRRAARQLLGAIFIAIGVAHLTHRRFYRSLLPYWLLEARREIDVVTGTLEVFGGALMFLPRLRKLARWTNLVVLAPTLLAAVAEARHPTRARPFSRPKLGVEPLGPLILAPGHAGLAGVLWWATEQD